LRCQVTKVLGRTMVNASCQLNQRLSSTSVSRVGLSGAPGLDLALLIERQLLAQEQILGCQRGSGAQAETQKWTRSATVLSQLNPALILHEAPCRRRCLS
jgi:3-hydroxy-3-methylglutaryl CoA synthase